MFKQYEMYEKMLFFYGLIGELCEVKKLIMVNLYYRKSSLRVYIVHLGRYSDALSDDTF